MGRALDLLGQKFGKLTVLEKMEERYKDGHTMWLCSCACGGSKIAMGTVLKLGKVKSCGCDQIIDLVGEVFGELTVLEKAEKRDNYKHTMWRCACTCGKEKMVSTGALRSGDTKSCGCINRKIIDLTGRVFGRLTVLKMEEERNVRGKVLWFCLCTCGNTKIALGGSLKAGRVKSCGCFTTLIDVTGQRFGMLTVIKRSEEKSRSGAALWLCRCDCGKEVLRDIGNLKAKGMRSCGCNQIIDLTGKKFGRLTALNIAYKRSPGEWMWDCLCDCANTCTVFGSALRKGTTRSCGCLQKDRVTLPNGVAAFNKVYGRYVEGARRKSRAFELTKEDFRKLTQQKCYYCGVEPKNVSKSKINNGDYVYNGIDRKNNDIGYVLNNCVPSCYDCNRDKGKMTMEEYLALLQRRANHFPILIERTQKIGVSLNTSDPDENSNETFDGNPLTKVKNNDQLMLL